MPNLKKFLQKFYVGPICVTDFIDSTTKTNLTQKIETLLKEKNINVHSTTDSEANVESLLKTKNNIHLSTDLIKNDADPKSDASSDVISSQFNQNKADRVKILAIKEELRGSLLSIASKLLRSEHTRLHHLSQAEQQLWNFFEKADIYEFLTGEKDTIPEFQFNWITPEAPAICQIPAAAQPPPVQPPQPVAQPPAAIVQPQPVALPPAPPPAPPPPVVQLVQDQQPQLMDQELQLPPHKPEVKKRVKPAVLESDQELRQ
jgi:hypothetical protein